MNALAKQCLGEPSEKPKVSYNDNPLEFDKSFEDPSWNHRPSTPRRSETNGTAERVVRRIKEGTSAVLLQSGLDEKWWACSMRLVLFLCQGLVCHQNVKGIEIHIPSTAGEKTNVSVVTSRSRNISRIFARTREGAWSISKVKDRRPYSYSLKNLG